MNINPWSIKALVKPPGETQTLPEVYLNIVGCSHSGLFAFLIVYQIWMQIHVYSKLNV